MYNESRCKKFLRLKSFIALHRNQELWLRLTEREIIGRYRGSALGMGWSFINPLAMLCVYTFVFSQVFKARWGGLETNGPLGFAINLFAGLIIFNLFSECASRAPNLIVNNPNYVKKVVFPLDVLGSVAVGTACFHALTSVLILIVFELIAFKTIPITILWLPLVWLPLLLGSIGVTWILSAAGVFLRDIGQLIGVSLNILMFISPIFFPSSSLPERWQFILNVNPLAQVINQMRAICIEGNNPDASYIVVGSIVGMSICEISFRIFTRSQKAFADVI